MAFFGRRPSVDHLANGDDEETMPRKTHRAISLGNLMQFTTKSSKSEKPERVRRSSHFEIDASKLQKPQVENGAGRKGRKTSTGRRAGVIAAPSFTQLEGLEGSSSAPEESASSTDVTPKSSTKRKSRVAFAEPVTREQSYEEDLEEHVRRLAQTAEEFQQRWSKEVQRNRQITAEHRAQMESFVAQHNEMRQALEEETQALKDLAQDMERQRRETERQSEAFLRKLQDEKHNTAEQLRLAVTDLQRRNDDNYALQRANLELEEKFRTQCLESEKLRHQKAMLEDDVSRLTNAGNVVVPNEDNQKLMESMLNRIQDLEKSGNRNNYLSVPGSKPKETLLRDAISAAEGYPSPQTEYNDRSDSTTSKIRTSSETRSDISCSCALADLSRDALPNPKVFVSPPSASPEVGLPTTGTGTGTGTGSIPVPVPTPDGTIRHTSTLSIHGSADMIFDVTEASVPTSRFRMAANRLVARLRKESATGTSGDKQMQAAIDPDPHETTPTSNPDADNRSRKSSVASNTSSMHSTKSQPSKSRRRPATLVNGELNRFEASGAKSPEQQRKGGWHLHLPTLDWRHKDKKKKSNKEAPVSPSLTTDGLDPHCNDVPVVQDNEGFDVPVAPPSAGSKSSTFSFFAKKQQRHSSEGNSDSEIMVVQEMEPPLETKDKGFKSFPKSRRIKSLKK